MSSQSTEYPPSAWHLTDHPFRSATVVTQLVAEVADRQPDAAAIVDGDRIMYTYAQLRTAANRLAWLLQDRGLGPGDHVAVVGWHRPHTVVALLGVAVSGAAFVPVDPRWPASRLDYVLSATGARCLIGAVEDLARVEGKAAGLTDLVALDVSTEHPRPLGPGGDLGLGRGTAVTATPGQVGHAEQVASAQRVGRVVLSHHPSSVLELGLGAGLLLREVAKHVDLYAGIDPSESVVRAGNAWAKETGVFVDLVPGSPEQVAELLPGSFDVAVLAGNVASFPSLRYLNTVLDGLATTIRPGGVVLLTDLPLPGTAVPGQLAVPVDFVESMRGGAWSQVRVRNGGGADDPPADRYDVELRRSDQPVPEGTPETCEPRPPGPRIWTGWHVDRHPGTDPPQRAHPNGIAYVLFTSGSTGQPKGVAVGHRSLVNLVQWVNGQFSVGPADRLLQVTSFCFDLSVYDVFGTLSAGASIRMVSDEELAEPARVARILESEPVTFWNSAPAILAWVLPFLSGADSSGSGRRSLRLVFLSGDWLPPSMPSEIRANFPAAVVVNLGGATETTIWSNFHTVDTVDPSGQSFPYGRPVWNSRSYVLDESGEPAPVGVAGDLYTAGPCLAIGYHGDPAQTARRFLPDLLVPGERMYATGDRAQWRPDGEIQFLGRLDHQVKIRGYRVELGEIESAMASLDPVRAAVVVTVDTAGARSLAGFYTCRPPGLPVERMRAVLRERLPEYMLPGRLFVLDEFPLTGNGKTDRAALSELARG